MKNCIVLHLYHQYFWPQVWSYLKDIKDENTDLYVTVNTIKTKWYETIKNNSTEVYVVENKGMDFGGFIYAYNKIKHIPYKTITKLHFKSRNSYKTAQGELLSPSVWTHTLYEPLVSSKVIYNGAVEKFYKNNSVQVYGSRKCYRRENVKNHLLVENLPTINKVNEILGLRELSVYEFIAGTIFMVSKSYLDFFFNNKEMDLYELLTPYAPANGSLAHALERLIVAQVNSFEGKIELK